MVGAGGPTDEGTESNGIPRDPSGHSFYHALQISKSAQRQVPLFNMKIVNFVLLLIAAALCIQAVTHEAETGDTVDLGSVVGESAGVGRRGGLISSGSFVLMSPGANRAGNDEEE